MTRNKQIDLNEALSVYSCKDGKCCCGCAGKHSYPSAFVEEASANRGYAVTADEVNDREVKRVLSKVNVAIARGDAEDGGNHISVVEGARLYIVYLRKAEDMRDCACGDGDYDANKQKMCNGCIVAAKELEQEELTPEPVGWSADTGRLVW